MRYSVKRKNGTCRALMHAAHDGYDRITDLRKALDLANVKRSNYSGYKVSTKDLINEKSKVSDAVNIQKATKQASDLEKSIANSEWYERNKAWKQAYNKDYYQRNKDYWKQRYEQAQLDQSNASGMHKSLINQWNEIKNSGGGIVDWDKRNLGINDQEFASKKYESEANIAKINYERAVNEYNSFMNAYGNKQTSSISSTLVNAGKSFLSGAKSAMSSLSSTISSGFSKFKSLFS